jgi:hypothetical protein
MKHETRESWLNAALVLVGDHLSAKTEMSVPAKTRVSVGWPGGRGKKNTTIGQCWPATLSSDSSVEIFISPVLDDPSRVMDVLLHEAIHAADGNASGHKGAFRRAALAVGLVGKMTATEAGPELKPVLAAFVEQLGPYPHAKLDLNHKDRKRQTTRMIKCSCSDCGYTVRTTRRWLEFGAPICPCNDLRMDVEGGEDE